jgi:hypothetical protein
MDYHCLNPEDIKNSILDKALPVNQVKRQGVYFLVKNDEIDYVGQTVNLYSRLGTHEKLKRYHRVAFLPIPEKSSLNDVENYYIRTFQPRLNIKGKI